MTEELELVGCFMNATNPLCAAVKGSAYYLSDFIAQFNTSCGPFTSVNESALMLTSAVDMDGVKIFVGGFADAVVKNASYYAEGWVHVGYCGHEVLNGFVGQALDSTSALVGAAAAIGAIGLFAAATWGTKKAVEACREKGYCKGKPKESKVVIAARAGDSSIDIEADASGETRRLLKGSSSNTGYKRL